MQINSSTTWQLVKTQSTYSRLFKFLPFSCCYSNKPFLLTTAAKTCFARYQKASNGKINSTEVFLMIERTSVWTIIPNGLCYRPQDPKNHFFELGLQEFASLALKKLQTTKLTPQKSSWRWKEQVCEKSAQTDFAIDHITRKTSWEASKNSPTVTFHFAEPSPLLFDLAELSPLLRLLSEPAITWSGHPLTRFLIKILIWIANTKTRCHSPRR